MADRQIDDLVLALRDLGDELHGIRSELRVLPERLRHQADLARCDAAVGHVGHIRALELERLEERLRALDVEPVSTALRLVS